MGRALLRFDRSLFLVPARATECAVVASRRQLVSPTPQTVDRTQFSRRTWSWSVVSLCFAFRVVRFITVVV